MSALKPGNVAALFPSQTLKDLFRAAGVICFTEQALGAEARLLCCLGSKSLSIDMFT